MKVKKEKWCKCLSCCTVVPLQGWRKSPCPTADLIRASFPLLQGVSFNITVLSVLFLFLFSFPRAELKAFLQSFCSASSRGSAARLAAVAQLTAWSLQTGSPLSPVYVTSPGLLQGNHGTEENISSFLQ